MLKTYTGQRRGLTPNSRLPTPWMGQGHEFSGIPLTLGGGTRKAVAFIGAYLKYLQYAGTYA